MSGVEGTKGAYEVGAAIEDNEDVAVRSLDISNNKLGEVTQVDCFGTRSGIDTCTLFR